MANIYSFFFGSFRPLAAFLRYFTYHLPFLLHCLFPTRFGRFVFYPSVFVLDTNGPSGIYWTTTLRIFQCLYSYMSGHHRPHSSLLLNSAKSNPPKLIKTISGMPSFIKNTVLLKSINCKTIRNSITSIIRNNALLKFLFILQPNTTFTSNKVSSNNCTQNQIKPLKNLNFTNPTK